VAEGSALCLVHLSSFAVVRAEEVVEFAVAAHKGKC
jgi:hypothetical protein